MRFLMVSVMAVLLVGCAGQQGGEQAPVNLASAQDSLSYAYGVDIGKKIKSQLDGLQLDLSPDVVTAAVGDVMRENELQMSDDQMKASFESYSKQREAEMASAREEQSAQADAAAAAGAAFLEANKEKEGVVVLPSGLQYRVIEAGTGPKPTPEDTVVVHYRGTLIDGSEFDSSHKRGEPAEFELGRVIPGWTEGLQLMKEGATYELVIPSDLAYGNRSVGRIPANSTLVFEVELLDVKE